jgi:hypothetical protein
MLRSSASRGHRHISAFAYLCRAHERCYLDHYCCMAGLQAG